jgi:DNA-binding transcriptional ArsR family regulator
MDDAENLLFKALADPTRRALLDALVDRDGQTLFELCTRMAGRSGIAMTRQAVSQHLDVLEAAGLVHVRREGRYRLHDVDLAPLRPLRERWVRAEERTDR